MLWIKILYNNSLFLSITLDFLFSFFRSLNKHENLCCEVITDILGSPSRIRRPDFSKIPRGLELNIYYPQYGFAIEVQGKQHVKHFHKDPEESEKQLMRD